MGKNEEVLNSGNTFPQGKTTRVECCGTLKKDALKTVLDKHRFNGVIVGVRRDEEPTRAKERYFSPRDKNMEWNVEDQPPELWDQFKTDYEPGTHIRIHPLLHWTELNIWEYIERENIPVIPLYFSECQRRDALPFHRMLSLHVADQIRRSQCAGNNFGIARDEDARTGRTRPG